MRFQRFIQKNSTKMMWSSASLIALAFVGRGVQVEELSLLGMILASVLGAVPVLIHAVQALRARVISIELLVSIAVIGAFVIGEFDESAIVTFLFTFGSFLEKWTLSKTRSSIKNLTQMAPTTATLASGESIDIDEVEIGATLLVKTGGQIPVDASVIKGSGYVNEASITGESRSIKKNSGDKVFAGTMLENGSLYILAEKMGEDTTFGKIIALVEEAQDAKSPAEKFIDRFAKYYTPAVLILALLIFMVTRNFQLAITILVLGCPGALVIGAPVSNVAGIGNGAKHGVLIKGGDVMHTFSKIDTLVFDKTGTLTLGNAEVVAVKTYGLTDKTLPALTDRIATVESQSDHPLARAIVRFIGNFNAVSTDEISVIKGQGISATNLLIGNEKLLTENNIVLTEEQRENLFKFQAQGASTVLVAVDDQLKIIYAIADEIRPEALSALTRLRQQGISRMIMLTGDNAATAQVVARQLGIDEVQAELLPEQKAAIIQTLKQEGRKIAFIGDGINDSPSLASADIGIAMGSGTDVAVDVSDIVLMNSSFTELVHAYGLTRTTVRNMTENIIIAVAVVFFLLTGLVLGGVTMASGMFVHEASILVVILNAMRLIRYQ
ncbi:heavy metal translocating P-type ATPase [Lactococcus allomyrinae]|uniref:Cd(2+)-exporting ATPase n=1 Tax=Lactococcus allomyrinae TaxID=2419773 RepID=A0A387BLL7_9LACT|nr:heavy metal translocating P-type ATPase [Lactococcus allomyrinae]AYG01880.1 heavy metal translocating P-type ATPase [Lactococcus allomyrinae]